MTLKQLILIGLLTTLITSSKMAKSQHPDGDAKPQSANLAITNARIWTGVPTSKAGQKPATQPSAIAIRESRIVAIGDEATIRPFLGSDTTIIDAKGKRVVPGLVDSHAHVASGGFQLQRLSLRDVKSKEAFIKAVAEGVQNKVQRGWLEGGRWSVESWTSQESPTRYWLDPISGNTPVLLSRMDGHQALANTAALKIAGINATGPADPVGGEIVRDPKTGEPTGILKEAAMNLVRAHIPEPDQATTRHAILLAMKHLNSLGITSVHDMSNPDHLPAYADVYDSELGTVRITTYLQTDKWHTRLHDISNFKNHADAFRWIGFKGYMDGSLGSRTAFMQKAYTDAPKGALHPHGQLTAFAQSREEFQMQISACEKAGVSVAVHAIGDEANHLLLNAYESATAGRKENTRHRVEHAQHLLPSDIQRFAKIGVVASMQPLHKADDARYAEQRLGKNRLHGSYAYRQLVDAGAIVIFGSDWPVVSANPFQGIAAAVNAKTVDGKTWLPAHSLTVEEALRAYTYWPAWAAHQEDRLGSLEVGKYADLVMLSEDPFAIAKDRLGEIKPELTIFSGHVVYKEGGSKRK